MPMILDPSALAEQAATAVTGAAILVAVAVWLRVRSWSPTMPVLLELLLAAGLLRLGASDTWRAIATAGAIVAIRTLIKLGVGGRPPRAAPSSSDGPQRG